MRPPVASAWAWFVQAIDWLLQVYLRETNPKYVVAGYVALNVGYYSGPRKLDHQLSYSGEVLKKMSGRWLLESSGGKERVTIREDGGYLVDGQPEPTFFLNVLAWDEKKSVAEVAKDDRNGQRLQSEYLKITLDPRTGKALNMAGYAKQDGHNLVYSPLLTLAKIRR